MSTTAAEEPLPPPGTRLDLLGDAHDLGTPITDRLLTDWRTRGLIGAPTRRRSGPHGQDLALFSSQQRALFRAIVRDHGRGVDNAWLAAYPIYAWLHGGDDWVEIKQARRALLTAVGTPVKSRRAAAQTARLLVDSINLNGADRHAIADFKAEIIDQLAGDGPNEEWITTEVKKVFEPGDLSIQRAPHGARINVETLSAWLLATMTAARRVAKYTDEQLLHARLVFRTTRHEYLQLRPGMQAEAAPDLAHLFAPPKANDDLRSCVSDLLLILGLETLTRQRATQP